MQRLQFLFYLSYRVVKTSIIQSCPSLLIYLLFVVLAPSSTSQHTNVIFNLYEISKYVIRSMPIQCFQLPTNQSSQYHDKDIQINISMFYYMFFIRCIIAAQLALPSSLLFLYRPLKNSLTYPRQYQSLPLFLLFSHLKLLYRYLTVFIALHSYCNAGAYYSLFRIAIYSVSCALF